MENKNIIIKKEREDIFNLFIKEHRLRFSEIEKRLNIRSNHLNYHIKKMVEEGILEKKEDYYFLTTEAEKIIPFFAHVTGKEKGCLPVIIAAVMDGDNICLLKREKRPYQGYWGMIGGKLRHSETVEETALREVKEETCLDCKFENVISVLHERLLENDNVKNSIVIFFCRLITKKAEVKPCEDGEVKWFNIKELPENIIPSDKLMIEELMNKDFCFKEVVMKEKDRKLVSMDVW